MNVVDSSSMLPVGNKYDAIDDDVVVENIESGMWG